MSPPANRNYWITRPLSPGTFAMMAFTLIVVVLILGAVIVMSGR